MACQGCINRQKKLVSLLCRKGLSKFCVKAQERLARMEGIPQEDPQKDTNEPATERASSFLETTK